MSLLKPAANQTAYMKVGILGFQGSGKTFTASRLASGLAKLNKENPKVAFFDTEKGSDFFVQYFKEQGIQFDVAKSRSFIDLIEFMKEVEKGGYDVAIIDSITHVWNDLRTSYEKRLRRNNGLLFQDWGKVKGEWQQFTDAFINSKIHTIVLGRAGYEYDMSEDESGKMQLSKSGIKMKAEGEFGYESDLLIEMERINREGDKGYINRAYIIKDRTDTMNGKLIDFPTFENFLSVVKHLNIGGEHMGVDTTRDSQELFDNPDYSYSARKKQQEIAIEELAEALVLVGLNGTSQDVLKRRTDALINVFGTSSKTAIESKSADELRIGIKALKEFYGGNES